MITKFFVKLITFFIFFITSTGTILFFLFFYYGRALPDYQFLQTYRPYTTSCLYDDEFNIMKEYAYEKRFFTPIEEIPSLLIQAFLSAEDKNFYTHKGIDFFRLFKTALKNTIKGIWANKPGGASTLTQQVAKNFLVGNQRSFERKIREAIVALRIESTLSKDRILELYLNEIYLGIGVYGVTAAAQVYFNKNLNELNLSECAFLASLPKAPAFYHPAKEYKRAKERRDWVIKRLLEDHIIDEHSAQNALNEPLPIPAINKRLTESNYFVDEVRRQLINIFGEKDVYTAGLNIFTTCNLHLQTILEECLKKGIIDYDRRHGWRGPLSKVVLKNNDSNQKEWIQALHKFETLPAKGKAKVAIVLNIIEEKKAEIGFSDGTKDFLYFENIKWARSWKDKDNLGPEITKISEVLNIGDIILVQAFVNSNNQQSYDLHQIPLITGGAVILDAHKGQVLALSGGYSHELSQFNCATQAWRQPGSAFKPFVYLAALEKGYTPESIIYDTPLEISLGEGLGIYAPKNLSRRYYGPSPLRLGIERSRNVMTVRLAQQIGIKSVQEIAQRLNIVENMPLQLAMALGAGETTVLRLTTAYAMIVNGGKKITPIFIKHIQNSNGQSLYDAPLYAQEVFQNKEENTRDNTTKVSDQRPEIISLEHAKTMTEMLENVAKRGTAKTLAPLMEEFKIILGGKTGTTNECKDAWFVGFISLPNQQTMVVGIFLGFSIPQPLGDKEGGTKTALPVFEHFVRQVMKIKE